jgi:hypothetical protein
MNGSSDTAAAGEAGEAVTNAKQVLDGAGLAAAAAAVDGTESSSAPPPTAGSTAASASGGSENAATGGTAAAGAGADAGGPGTRARSPRPSPRPKKRQRPSLTTNTTTATSVHTAVKNSDDEADDDGEADADADEQDETSAAKDAFYLRHQNKALASELRSYKRQIDLLVAERDHRRGSCDEAREGVDKLAEIWAEVEGCVKAALVGLELVSRLKLNYISECMNLSDVFASERVESSPPARFPLRQLIQGSRREQIAGTFFPLYSSFIYYLF